MPIRVVNPTRPDTIYYLFTREEREAWYEELMFTNETNELIYRNLASKLLSNSYPNTSCKYVMMYAGVIGSLIERPPPAYAPLSDASRGGSYLLENDYRAARAVMERVADEEEEPQWVQYYSPTTDPTTVYTALSDRQNFTALSMYIADGSSDPGQILYSEVLSGSAEPQDDFFCSPDNPLGACPPGEACRNGVCIPATPQEEGTYEGTYEDEGATPMTTALVVGGVAAGLGLMFLLAR